MSSIITGAFGFTGRHLTKAVSGKVICLTRSNTKKTDSDSPNNYAITCDLLDTASVNKIIKQHQPKAIYHLAGSFTQNYENDYNANVTTTKNILEATKEFSPKSRILLIGSAAEYGLLKSEDCPVSENAQLQPCNFYGLTKIYQK